jgi:hypothetical protein
MNDDAFNMDARKFLKRVGVTSQREIELAVHDELQPGRKRKICRKDDVGSASLNILHVIEDKIALE